MKLFPSIGAIMVCLIASVPATATIWRVNNNAGVNANHTTIQAAHDAAAPGDTIHVEGSLTFYGQTTISKKLFIVGPGYYLDQVSETQANVFPATLNGMLFNSGAEGSVLTGVEIIAGQLEIRCNDIKITRNRFTHVRFSPEEYNASIRISHHSSNTNIPADNIEITQNYGGSIVVNNASVKILIANNYLLVNDKEGDNTTSEVIFAHAQAVLLVKNNVFKRGRITVSNSTFTNNIMLHGSFTAGNLNNSFLHNLGNGTQFGTANGNQSNVTMDNVFVGIQTGVSTDGQFKLRPGSPAIGAGEGSTVQNPVDCGIYGGVTKYVLCGQAAMPAIYYMEVQAVGTTADPIDVKLKVKSAGK